MLIFNENRQDRSGEAVREGATSFRGLLECALFQFSEFVSEVGHVR